MPNIVRSARHTKAHSTPFQANPASVDAAFDAVFDSSAEALLVMDSTGLIYRANRRGRELLRLQDNSERAILGDLLSCPPADHIRTFWADPNVPTKPQALDASLVNGFPVRIALRAILPDSGHMLLCLEEGSIVERADAKWRHLQAELRSVLDSVEAGVLLVDPTGRLRFSNARFGELFGLGLREIAEMATFQALHEVIADRFRDAGSLSAPWNSYTSGAGEPVHDELELTRPSRKIIERFSRPVLDAAGREAGWLELYSDVTGERQIQSKMLQTEKMAALGQLVSGIAHELNNPLTAIMGYTQLLLGHGLADSQLSEANKIFQETERARRIVKNLLYFARENKPERIRVDINEIVERTLALRTYELKVKNIIVRCEMASDLPQTMADPYQLQQVILNLIINAEQALLEERGQGCVCIRTSHSCQNSANRAGEWISLEVSDDGPGVSPDIASRIFEPFFTTKSAGAGTGLGLSIVYGIVQQHDGDVTFENQPGAGVRFIVELPVIAADAVGHTASLRQPADPAKTIPGGRILVVEDESTVAQLIVDVLREEGHSIEAVLDSQEGLTRLSRAHYDLVICDLRMPRLDGPAFYHALVSAGSPIQHKILFVTGDTLAPSTLEFLEPHGLPYLVKPFLVEELKLAVNGLLTANRNVTGRLRSDLPAKNRPTRTWLS